MQVRHVRSCLPCFGGWDARESSRWRSWLHQDRNDDLPLMTSMAQCLTLRNSVWSLRGFT